MKDFRSPEPAGPVIVLVSEEHAERLRDEFWRYSREYELRVARSSAEALAVTADVLDSGGQVAMYAADCVLPDEDIRDAMRAWRAAVPTACRVVVPPAERFLAYARELRPEMSKGTFDSFLLMPQGVRDEEFHNAITDLLADWNSTVADPEVISAHIIAEESDALVRDLQDFIDRMGMSSRVHPPESETGRAALARLPGAQLPVVWLAQRDPIAVRSVRELASSTYRSMTECPSKGSPTWRSSALVPRAWPQRSTGPLKGSPQSCSRPGRSVGRLRPAR
jgi:thioredoxin reductase (NADPH)